MTFFKNVKVFILLQIRSLRMLVSEVSNLSLPVSTSFFFFLGYQNISKEYTYVYVKKYIPDDYIIRIYLRKLEHGWTDKPNS